MELEHYIRKWNLTRPSKLAETPTSHVYKVAFENRSAVIKIFTPLGREDEAEGALALQCFNGTGAVRLLAADEGAHLLEFINGRSLKDLVLEGKDSEATEIICDVLRGLHSYEGEIPSGIKTMKENFSALFRHTKNEGSTPLLQGAAEIAERLLETESEKVLLHGDIHHKNILKSSERGWLVIDPKGLIGERTYDFANVFYNPDDMPDLVETKARIHAISAVFTRHFGVKTERFLEFAFVYGCLSACWAVDDGLNPNRRLRIAGLIQNLLSEVRIS